VSAEVHVGDRAKVAWWRDERKRGLAAQVLVAFVILLFVWFLANNMVENQRKLGVPLSLSFLDSPAGFQLSFATLSVTLDSPISRILTVGALNTLLCAAIAAIVATTVGVIIGVMRLSRNWLVARIAATYIEIIRNVPLLLQLVFWYGVVLKLLPNPKDSLSLFEAIFLSKKGLVIPKPVLEPLAEWVFVAFAAGILATIALARWAHKRQEATGQQFPTFLAGIGLIVALPIVTSLLLGNPVTWQFPEKGAFNYVGGLAFQPEVVALILGLALNSAAFMAEIVRSGIMAVSHGQTEASLALGLRSSWTLRLVIMPQAMRVMVPPMISQYLNVVKNSTLAGFIGYPDLFSVIGTSQNQTGRAVECVTILMLFYLGVSLIISTIMNVYNKRVALVER
jgi:general L-amino acid transport system permease protein